MAVLAIAGWFALVLQLWLMLKNPVLASQSVWQTIIQFLSYFTILTSLLVTLSLSLPLLLPASRAGNFFTRPSVISGITCPIILVGIVYSLVLRERWNPQGSQKLADLILHDLIPILYFLYWLISIPACSLRWKDSLKWLIYPGIYLPYMLVLGAMTSRYPYHFIDLNQLGYQTVLFNSLGILLSLLVIGFLLIGINRFRARKLT